MKAIADTGLIVAFGNRTDRFHPSAVDIAGTIVKRSRFWSRPGLPLATSHLPQVTYRFQLPYSYRSATMGSTFVARRAGKRQANKPMATIMAATEPSVQGSEGETPQT
jgi:hypothetical protein